METNIRDANMVGGNQNAQIDLCALFNVDQLDFTKYYVIPNNNMVYTPSIMKESQCGIRTTQGYVCD